MPQSRVSRAMKAIQAAVPSLRAMVAVGVSIVVMMMAVSVPVGAAAHGHRGPRLHGLTRRSNTLASTASPLVDLHGPVRSSVHPYAIWWGPQGGFPTDVVTAMTSFFGGLQGSDYLAVADQYLRGAHASLSPVVNLFDPSPPSRSSSQASIAAEVAKMSRKRPDPAGIYFVFTSTASRGGSYCAWHAAARVGTRTTAFAYMPNITGVANCDPGDRYGANSYSEGARALVNVTAHELMEAITDPQPTPGTSAWLDRGGEEIGDKCAWLFTGPVHLANGSTWQLQEEWSNAVSGCAQG